MILKKKKAKNQRYFWEEKEKLLSMENKGTEKYTKALPLPPNLNVSNKNI